MGRGDPPLRVTLKRSPLLAGDPDCLRRVSRKGVMSFVLIECGGFSVEPGLPEARRLLKKLVRVIQEADRLDGVIR